MKDLVQCTVSRDDFQRWLDWGNAPLTICTGEKAVTMLLKIEKKPVDYLYQTAVEADGCISWKNGMTFCGVHNIGKKTLYLTKGLSTILADGQAPFVAKAIPSMVDEICGRINRRVEESIANSRNNLSVQDITSWNAARELKDYVEDGAHREALARFFSGNEPDGQFHSGYALDQLPEAAFMAWLQDPEGFIETEAEQYIKINQEKFLLQFLKNDALLAEYQALIQDPNNPLHRVKAISEAIKTSGAKTVTVTVQKMERNCPSGQGLLRCGDVTTPTTPVISPPPTGRSSSSCLAAAPITVRRTSSESPTEKRRSTRLRLSRLRIWRNVLKWEECSLDNREQTSPVQCENTRRYTIDELLARIEPQYREYKAAIRKCIAGLTDHAARLAAQGQEEQLPTFRRLITDMAEFWGLTGDDTPKGYREMAEQIGNTFDQVVSAARDSSGAPELSAQTKTDILNGLRLYAEEMMDCGDLEQWIAECDALSSQLQRDWRMEASSSQPLQAGMEMSKSDFWELIAGAKKECGQNMDASSQWLARQLIARGPQQTQDFHDILNGYLYLSYQYGLWTAASLMCENGCSDDGFIDFRAWLIAQGEEIYMAALADPDSLADVEAYGGCQFEELLYTGNETMKCLTGQNAYDNTDPAAYEALTAALKKDIAYGEGVNYPYEWDEIEAHFPRLCEKYLEPGAVEFHLKSHHTMWSSDCPDIQKAREGGPPERNGLQTDMKMEGI